MNLQQTPPPATSWNTARSPFIRYPSQRSPWSVVKPVEVRRRVAAKREFVEWLDHQNPKLVAKAQEIAEREFNALGGTLVIKHGDNRNLGYSPVIPRFSQDMNIRRDVMSTLGQATPPFVGPTIPEEQAEEGWLDKLIGAATTIAPAYLQFQQQKEILDMQLERAKQGLPPLETAYMAPTVRVQTELGPEAQRAAREGITAGLGTLAFPLILVAGAFLLMQGGRRRRR